MFTVVDNDGNEIEPQFMDIDNGNDDTHQTKMIDAQSLAATVDSLSMKMESMLTSIQNVEQRINIMELRMNEEQNVADDDEFNRINNINGAKMVTQKMVSDNNITAEQQKLRSWLEDTVRLPQYYEVLIENGIDDLETVALLAEEQLKEIGIVMLGHRVKLLNEMQQLKSNENISKE